ncbi:MAG: cysteine hydrolase [Gordonibacter sp.]
MIDPRTAALLVIDMQNGFIDPQSALCVQGAAATVPACSRALVQARALGMPVFHVVRSYAEDGSDVEAVRHDRWAQGGKPVSGACANPHTMDEPRALAPQPGDRIIVKPRFSAFFNTSLDSVLRRLGVTTVVLIGTTTPNCIRTSCFDALSLDYNVAVIEDCTSSRTPAVQTANIEDMAHIGAQVITCADFCEQGLDDLRDVAGEVENFVRSMAAEQIARNEDGAWSVREAETRPRRCQHGEAGDRGESR